LSATFAIPVSTISATPRPGGDVRLMPMALKPLYRGVHGLVGDSWQTEVLRLGQRSRMSTPVGGVTVSAVWLPRTAVDDG
jgi:hypothetical protein